MRRVGGHSNGTKLALGLEGNSLSTAVYRRRVEL
jgi:hypothetical protein